MKYSKLSVFIPNFKNKPYFIGSQLRGVLGYALKKVVCINPSFKCDGCFAKDNCVYFDFYENKNSYHKYRFDYDLNEKDYKFNLYLFNDAIKETPYLISAIHKAITEIGFGKEREKYNFFIMKLNDEIIFDGEFKKIENYEKEFFIDEIKENIKIKLLTPLRIKKDNKLLLSDRLELKDIINSIYQRDRILNGLEPSKLPFEVKGEIKKTLYKKNLSRFSNRQKTKMQLDGLIGEIEVRGIDEKSFYYLKLGEIIGVGKQVSFGLGKIQIKDLNG